MILIMVSVNMCTHRIKKFGFHTVAKYLSFDEIHVTYSIEGIEVITKRFKGEKQNSESAEFFEDLCLQAQIDYTLSIKKDENI
jgi:hypothetical protein